MKAIIITKVLVEEREFNDLEEFIENLKRRFSYFIVSFELNSTYDLIVFAK
jgi:hypothetical protein